MEQQTMQTEESIRRLLMAGLIVSLVISIGLFVIAIRQDIDPIGRARAFAYMAMFRSSLILLAGFGFTLATYMLAAGGGTYIIARGAIAVGAFALVARAFTYFTQVRPKLGASSLVEEVQTIVE